MFENYMLFMVSVLFTLLVLFVIGVFIRITWDELIKPIIDRIKRQKDEYWKDQYRKEKARAGRLEGYLRRLTVYDPEILDHIDPSSVTRKINRDEMNFKTRVVVGFDVDGSLGG